MKTLQVSEETWEKIKDQVEAETAVPAGLKAYMVFSKTRDIFFGWAKGPAAHMKLTNARRVFSYPKHPLCGGPDSLAVYGPQDGTKAGPTVVEVEVMEVANAVVCTPEAVSTWMKKPQSW